MGYTGVNMKQEHENLRYTVDAVPVRQQVERDQRTSQIHKRMRLAHFASEVLRNSRVPRRGKLSRWLTHTILPPLGESVVCPTAMGFSLVVGEGDGENYYYNGIYEPGTLDVMKQCLREGDTFLDIGASIGQMTLHASRLVQPGGRVLAFEPHPARLASLLDGITINHAQNVVVYGCGLGEEEGAVTLYTDRVSPSMLSNAASESTKHRVSVKVMVCDQILEAEGVDQVRMMKLDVEGYELNVLRGARRLLSTASAPIVCIEHTFNDADPKAPFHFLRSLNDYRFFCLASGKGRESRLVELGAIEELKRSDNVFGFLPSHLDELEGGGLFA